MTDGNSISDEEYFQRMIFLPEKLNKCISALADTYFRDTDLKVYYIPYIINLKQSDGISQKELNSRIPCDKSRISVVVNELISKGLVYNAAKGRNSSLHLTEKGHGAHSVCRMFVDLVNKELFGGYENEKTVRDCTMEFDLHIDSVLAKLSSRSGE